MCVRVYVSYFWFIDRDLGICSFGALPKKWLRFLEVSADLGKSVIRRKSCLLRRSRGDGICVHLRVCRCAHMSFCVCLHVYELIRMCVYGPCVSVCLCARERKRETPQTHTHQRCGIDECAYTHAQNIHTYTHTHQVGGWPKGLECPVACPCGPNVYQCACVGIVSARVSLCRSVSGEEKETERGT